jgi:hypothetical protein
MSRQEKRSCQPAIDDAVREGTVSMLETVMLNLD